MPHRFVVGRPVSAVTTAFLAWYGDRLAAQGVTALLLIGDNASWHTSQAVRAWLRTYHQRVPTRQRGGRMVAWGLPVKSPWLNPIEPKWGHGKRAVSEPDRRLSAAEFEALIASLQSAAAYNRDDVVPAAAILWTDERREWESLVPRLRLVLPQLLTLGSYDQANRVGPAIWLRCVLAGRVPDVTIPPDVVPIIYLPGVSRPTLRATGDCSPELRPLAELQYRGVFWSQSNGKDWTIAPFLQSDRGGLGLDARTDSYLATLPSVQLRDVCLDDQLVKEHERILTGGFYAEVDLAYDALIAQEKNGRPFVIAALRPIHLSKREVLEALYTGRARMTTEEWK
jgi:DDE superfamily endonuclease